MSDLLVIMGSSGMAGTMQLYLDQLKAAEIDYWIEDVTGAAWLCRGGFISEKIKYIREFCKRFGRYKFIALSDAHDVTFYGTKEAVLKKIPKEGVLCAAEKNCYPDASLADKIPGRTPWRFVNGGLSAATPENFLWWCDELERHPLYEREILDQGFLNKILAEGSPLCQIDSETKLFFNLYGGYDELDFASGMPINTVCCTFPNFIHASGKWDAREMFARYERSLKSLAL